MTETTEQILKILRWSLAAVGLGWLLFWGGLAYAQRNVTATQLQDLQQQLDRALNDARARDLVTEQRLTRLETQLLSVLETINRVNNSLYALFGALLLQTILNFLPRKEVALPKRDTKP